MKEITNQLREVILANGASDVGFAKLSYESLDYAISIVVKLSDFVISQIDTAPTYTYFNHYKTANALID
ncbi:MAG: epoxyqueuosine reductase, partial [Clostridia bacterium]|nr:epoxyqueuosine reductase [Clostridia bacterium]